MKFNLKLKSAVMLLLTAMIWGFAFVAQRIGADYLGAFSYNGIRFLLGSVSMLPVVFVFEKLPADTDATEDKRIRKTTVLASVTCGTILFLASFLQQLGIALTGSAGKAGFMTGLYMVLTPILGFLLFRKKTGILVWIGAVSAVIGLYLISNGAGGTPGWGDVSLLAGAIFWAMHILVIDLFNGKRIYTLRFACGQYFVCAALNLICAFLFEEITVSGVRDAGISILYGGLMSVGIAYTLQILGQRDSDPTVASILLSLESVFSAVGGAVIFHERMRAGGYIGCVLMFCGILLAQIPADAFSGGQNQKKSKNSENR